MPKKLTGPEQARLLILEEKIESGMKRFIETGKALAEIRDTKLYMGTHSTFEKYTKERWGFTRQRAHQFIEHSAVAEEFNRNPLDEEIDKIIAREDGVSLSTTVDTVSMPVENKPTVITNEGQARELAKVPPKKRAQVVKQASQNGTVTAKAIKEAHEAVEQEQDDTGHPWDSDIAEIDKTLKMIDALHDQLRKVAKLKYAGGRKFTAGFFSLRRNVPGCTKLWEIRSHVKLSEPITCTKCDGEGCEDCHEKGYIRT